MIHEDRVRELTALARYDEEYETMISKAGRFYRADYVAREMIKSFFLGTAAYLLLFSLVLLYVGEEVLDLLSSVNLTLALVILAVSYIVFLALYLLVTYLIYQVRYTNHHKILKSYTKHLKKLQKIYVREERLRM